MNTHVIYMDREISIVCRAGHLYIAQANSKNLKVLLPMPDLPPPAVPLPSVAEIKQIPIGNNRSWPGHPKK